MAAKPSSISTAMGTYQDMFKLADDGKITRHTFEKYASDLQKKLETLSRIEAFFVYAGFMQIADAYKLNKFPEDGGNTYTFKQLNDVLKQLPKNTVEFVCTVFSRALFRAIDTNASGFISRDEWSHYLKVRDTFKSEGQAMRAFDSLDINKNGQISMEEYETMCVKFWKSAGADKDVQDFYGTKA